MFLSVLIIKFGKVKTVNIYRSTFPHPNKSCSPVYERIMDMKLSGSVNFGPVIQFFMKMNKANPNIKGNSKCCLIQIASWFLVLAWLGHTIVGNIMCFN